MSGENRRTGAIAEKSSIETDPIINAINDGIRGDIAFNLKHARYRATLILTYPAIDAMAYLDMPAIQTDVARKDFIRWASRHIRFPGTEQLTGEDLYGNFEADLRIEPVRAENGIERPVVLSQFGQAPNGKLARWSIDGKLQVDLKVLDGPV
jgi:hypothetical protein